MWNWPAESTSREDQWPWSLAAALGLDNHRGRWLAAGPLLCYRSLTCQSQQLCHPDDQWGFARKSYLIYIHLIPVKSLTSPWKEPLTFLDVKLRSETDPLDLMDVMYLHFLGNKCRLEALMDWTLEAEKLHFLIFSIQTLILGCFIFIYLLTVLGSKWLHVTWTFHMTCRGTNNIFNLFSKCFILIGVVLKWLI